MTYVAKNKITNDDNIKWAATTNVISRLDENESLPSNILDQNPMYINIVEVTGVEPVSL